MVIFFWRKEIFLMEKHKKCIARILVFEFYAAGYAHAILF